MADLKTNQLYKLIATNNRVNGTVLSKLGIFEGSDAAWVCYVYTWVYMMCTYMCLCWCEYTCVYDVFTSAYVCMYAYNMHTSVEIL